MARRFPRFWLRDVPPAVAEAATSQPLQAEDSSISIGAGLGVFGSNAPFGGERFTNPGTGQGTDRDHLVTASFMPRLLSPFEAETLYQQSWAIRKMIDIPADDMWARGRLWEDDDENAVKSMEDACMELGLADAMKDAVKAAKMFGSSLVIIMPSKKSKLDKPMDWEMLKEGGIANLLVIDRWSASISEINSDLHKKRYGLPHTYTVAFRSAETGSVMINSDYILRFDGMRPPMTEGWRSGLWERLWGTSYLSAVVEEVVRDAAMHGGIGHLVQESSVWVQKIQSFKDAIRGKPVAGEATAQQIGAASNVLRSLYRTQFIDAEDEVQRVNVSFAGLPDLMNQQHKRLAAMGDIPHTRFMSESPAGLSGTGEGEQADYSLKVASDQKNLLDPHFKTRLDLAIARHAGLEKAPEYRWLPLVDRGKLEDAEAQFKLGELVYQLYDRGLINEEESRELLSKIEFIGELGPWEMSEQLKMEQELEAERMQQQGEQQMELEKVKQTGKPKPEAK